MTSRSRNHFFYPTFLNKSKKNLSSENRILLVDDDSELREEIRDFLEDYGVTEVSSGDEALQILKKPNEIDLIILDVMMPGKNGLEVLK